MRLPIHSRITRSSLLLLLTLLVLTSPAHGRHHSPQAPSVPADDWGSLSRSANAAREAGRPTEAIPLYRRALALRPDWAEGWWYLGTLLYDGDQFRDAVLAFQKVAELAPQAPDVFNFLGLCEFEIADYDSALKHLQQGHSATAQDDPQLARVVSY